MEHCKVGVSLIPRAIQFHHYRKTLLPSWLICSNKEMNHA